MKQKNKKAMSNILRYFLIIIITLILLFTFIMCQTIGTLTE